jgi:excisionase family DNA binding protein
MGTETDSSHSGRGARWSSRPEREPPLTLPEAAEYLNVSQRFMRRLVAERRIVFHKLGHLLRFHVADLDRLLAAGRVEPAQPDGVVGRRGR